jgi:hypothetical protein
MRRRRSARAKVGRTPASPGWIYPVDAYRLSSAAFGVAVIDLGELL